MKGTIELHLNPDGRDMAYVSLPAHPGSSDSLPAHSKDRVGKLRNNHIHLLELMPDYKGAGVAFEFNTDGEIIGISLFPEGPDRAA